MSEYNKFLALFKLSVRQIWGGKSFLKIFLSSMIPAVVALIMRSRMSVSTLSEGMDFEMAMRLLYFGTCCAFLLQFVFPLIILANSASVLQDEVDERTLTYLLMRPISKWQILLGKYFGFVLCSYVAGLVGCGALLLAVGLPSNLGLLFPQFLVFARAMVGAALAYGAVFLAISVVLKRSFAVGMFYLIMVEIALSKFPMVLKKITIWHYLSGDLSSSDLINMPQFKQSASAIFATEITPIQAWFGLLTITIVGLAVGMIVFQLKEYPMTEEVA